MFQTPAHLLISTDLGSFDMMGFKDGPRSKVYLFPLSHCSSWKLDAFFGLIDLNLINGAPMGKPYIVYCWSEKARALLVSAADVVTPEAKKHRAHPNPFIKDNHSGEMQLSISRVA